MNWGDMVKEELTFQEAKRRLDEARDKLAQAQTDFIQAERGQYGACPVANLVQPFELRLTPAALTAMSRFMRTVK
jgi:hypothetical protein